MISGEFAGAIAAVLGTAIAGWLLDRWLGIRKWIGMKYRAKQARIEMDDTMRESWPTVVEGSTRNTQQFKALVDQIGGLGDQIKTGHAESNKRFDKQDASIAIIVANTWAEMRLSPLARFICDSEGRNQEVNPAYAEMLRVDERQLWDYGYKNFFRDPAFHAAFAQAAKEHRYFDEKTKACRGDGTCFIAHVTARPFPDDPSKGSPWRWYGVVMVDEELP